jgi:hypothetical protein
MSVFASTISYSLISLCRKSVGLSFPQKRLNLDANTRICFRSSGLINQEVFKELYPTLSTGYSIRKQLQIRIHNDFLRSSKRISYTSVLNPHLYLSIPCYFLTLLSSSSSICGDTMLSTNSDILMTEFQLHRLYHSHSHHYIISA